MRPDGRRITKRIRYGRGAVSLGLPDCGVILTFYQVLASAHAAENFLVAPPLNWVVREEADAILAISEDIKISTGSCRRGPEGEYPLNTGRRHSVPQYCKWYAEYRCSILLCELGRR